MPPGRTLDPPRVEHRPRRRPAERRADVLPAPQDRTEVTPWTVAGIAVQGLAMAWISFVTGLAFWSVALMVLGWRPDVVLTGSMEPSIRPGHVVVVAPVEGLPTPGRIVLVDDPTRVTGSYLHRVVRYDGDGRIITKGDANPTEDVEPVEPGRLRGEARLLVPAIGLPALWLREGRYLPLAGSALVTWSCAVICLAGVLPPRRRRRSA